MDRGHGGICIVGAPISAARAAYGMGPIPAPRYTPLRWFSGDGPIGDFMTNEQGAAGHHASAATHHGHAMRFHLDSARHYQVGKDYAHAAHQALVAHGHALRAIDHGNAATRDESGRGAPPASFLDARKTPRDGALYHAAAAEHHQQAEIHHGKAATHAAANDLSQEAEESLQAHHHAHEAMFYGDEAARHHVEHYGRAGPTAELL